MFEKCPSLVFPKLQCLVEFFKGRTYYQHFLIIKWEQLTD